MNIDLKKLTELSLDIDAFAYAQKQAEYEQLFDGVVRALSNKYDEQLTAFLLNAYTFGDLKFKKRYNRFFKFAPNVGIRLTKSSWCEADDGDQMRIEVTRAYWGIIDYHDPYAPHCIGKTSSYGMPIAYSVCNPLNSINLRNLILDIKSDIYDRIVTDFARYPETLNRLCAIEEK